MKKLNLLSRAEMTEIKGGIISPEVWYEMCLDRASAFTDPDPYVQQIIQNLMTNDCDKTYVYMPGRIL